MPQVSAGLVMYRKTRSGPEFFLVHPGGPFFAKKDDGAWTIPKGLADENENLTDAALREFREETGLSPTGALTSLGFVKLKSGKKVHAWMVEGEWNPDDGIRSNTFRMEWPPRSGKSIDVPEADRAGWFSFDDACRKINAAQVPLLKRAVELLGKV